MGNNIPKCLRDISNASGRLDTSDQFQTILSAVVDIGAVASGVVLTGLAIVGVITGGAAFAAAGEILAVLAAIVAIVGLFEGSEERDVISPRFAFCFGNASTNVLPEAATGNSGFIPEATGGATSPWPDDSCCQLDPNHWCVPPSKTYGDRPH